MPGEFRREYLTRLPLPLAQLYVRAHNGKSPQSRHNLAYFLCEALVRLAGAPATAEYLREIEFGAPRSPRVDQQLQRLSRPSAGQWLGMLRELARHFGGRADAAAHPLGRLWEQLTTARRDLPGVLALYRRIKHGPDGSPAGDQSCTVLDLLDRLVAYRNAVIGHGAEREQAFYEREMGPLLFPALDELLAEGTLDVLGPRGSRLVSIADVRLVAEDRCEVGLKELVGTEGLRIAPLSMPARQAQALPNQIAILWPGRPWPLPLDPLLVYRETELTDEVLFLNCDRSGKQIEYLSYTTGRTERDATMAAALARLISRVTGRPVDERELDRLGDQSVTDALSAGEGAGVVEPAGTVLGDYELLGEIGRGGMGVVYLARQLSLGRLVALKMLPAELAADEVALARFRREVRLLARCDHPHIVKILASGTFADGRQYYAMEYVPGCDLEQLWQEVAREPSSAGSGATAGSPQLSGSSWNQAVLSASRKRRERTARAVETATGQSAPAAGAASPGTLPLPPLPELPPADEDPGGYVRRVVAIVRDAAQAVATVHAQDVIHRDVKPANLMLTPDGSRVVLMDFGLAKGQTTGLTSRGGGDFLGTLRYAAPEQLAAATLTVGPAVDVRGLGIVLWELLTRRRLFAEAEDATQLADRVMHVDVPRLRSVDPAFDRDLEAIVARATERRAADRIESAAKLAEYLDLYLSHQPLPIRAPRLGELWQRWVSTHWQMVATLAAAVLVVLGITVAAFALITRANQRLETVNDKLKSTNTALRSANDVAKTAWREADRALRRNRRVLARNFLERGVGRARAGEPWNGMLDFMRAYDELEAIRVSGVQDSDADRLRASALTLMGGWAPSLGSQLPPSGWPAAKLSMAYSPDGGTVYVGDVAWDVNTGRRRGTLQGLKGDADELLFSPDGRTLLTSWSGTLTGPAAGIQLWDAFSGELRGGLPTAYTVDAMAFPSDGSTVVIGCEDGSAQVWDVATQKRLRIMRHESPVTGVACSPDGRTVLIGCENGTAWFWDLASGERRGEPLRVEVDRYGRSRCKVGFSPDGRTAHVVGESALFWDVSKQAPRGPLPEEHVVKVVAYHPRGPIVATGAFDEVRLWDIETGGLRVAFQMKQGHERPDASSASVVALAFSPDGRTLIVGAVTGTDCGYAQLFDVTLHTDETVAEAIHGPLWHPHRVEAVAFSPRGDTFLTSGSRSIYSSGAVRIWDAQSRRPLSEVPREASDAVAYNADRMLIAEAPYSRYVQVWSVSSDKRDERVLEHDEEIVKLRFAQRGQTLLTLTAGFDAKVRLWDTTTRKSIGGPLPEQGAAASVDVSPDGQIIVIGAENGTSHVHDAATAELKFTLRCGTSGAVEAVKFSRDGQWIATADADGKVRVWDAGTGDLLKQLDIGRQVEILDWAPDRTLLTEGSYEGRDTVQIWDTTEENARDVIAPHTEGLVTAAFSPDGRRIITIDTKYVARLWDAATGNSFGQPFHAEGVITFAFSPDSRVLLTDGTDGKMQLWDVNTGYPCGQAFSGRTALGFSADGRTMASGGGGKWRVWTVPAAFPDEPEEIRAWIKCQTGKKVVADTAAPLALGDVNDLWQRHAMPRWQWFLPREPIGQPD